MYLCCVECTGQSIIQISIYGRRTSLLLAEHTKDKTWRQVWTSITRKMHSFIDFSEICISLVVPEPVGLSICQYLQLTNARGHVLRFCSGCRADANEAAVILLPSNITVFTLDFSGSGLSDGDYVSLGWHERDDLKVVVSYLRSNKQISRIGLWGRSMGAVTWYIFVIYQLTGDVALVVDLN
ncbi:hypothetical protein FEM48_Zijuj01G0257600 [Ziziphus jujuba var. spinosa]|uniref:Serine aminopeptidase S33 domain-containing protein n=1 Tax=Ziziphus jujuba var. spinosa TaxID=714518 RepID=A0A978W4T7_ZIZJJ|nr:hypothetical protein FEM48_Zijuj01G0257600 [Ziziphus jujuba var. spinosa]